MRSDYALVALVLVFLAGPLAAATFTVTNNAATGAGSLNQAILDANASPGLDTIVFAIGTGPKTITPTASYLVTDAVIIDGTTQPGFAGSPIIELAGNPGINGITLGADGCTVRGLVLNRFGQALGIFTNSNVVEGNFVGTDLTGMAASANQTGVTIFNGNNNVIGGSTPAARNVVAGNAFSNIGVSTGSGNVVQGNYIGTNAAATAALAAGADGIGIFNGASNTMVVGNVISGNANGIAVIGPVTTATTIRGNFIGTNAAGTAAIANSQHGVNIFNGALNTVVGGTAAADRNVISGNTRAGVFAGSATTTGVQIQGNYIGLNAAGTSAIANAQSGISVNSAPAVAITGNVVSGNSPNGINFSNSSSHVLTGNFIGTNAAGTAAVPNLTGVNLSTGSNHTIGGTSAGAGNVISGNTGTGLNVFSTTGTLIAGNIVGLDAAGSNAVGNGSVGIILTNSTNTAIGGTTAGARNVVSGNSEGIVILGPNPGTVIQGNFIGTDASGTASRGNTASGITTFATAALVGGTAAGAGNRIWFNGRGVQVFGTAAIQRNSIDSSGTLGIDLGGDGVTPNDPGDVDGGANLQQNFPVLGVPVVAAGATTVTGTLNSTPSTAFTIELFDSPACQASGFGEGRTYAASFPVTTDAFGNASFNVVVPMVMTVITATATDPAGNTSEFSQCAFPATLTIGDVTVTEGTGGTTTATFTVTRTPAIGSTSSVQYATANGTATAPADYTSASGTITFNPGDATKTIAVTVASDNIDESNETFFVNLSNATNAFLADTQAQATITDDDTSTISIADATAFEGSPVVFNVTLSVPSATAITVNYSTAANTAAAGSDYTTTSGVLTFAPGETLKTISVATILDTVPSEPNETFFVNLTSATTITRSQGVGTISDAANIPALSPWILLLMAGALAIVGGLLLKR